VQHSTLLGDAFFAAAFRAKPLAQNYQRAAIRQLSKLQWQLRGVHMPEEAIAEATYHEPISQPDFSKEADIGISEQYLATSPDEQRRTLVHELWHLVETEQDIQTGALLTEGTATAAQYHGVNLPPWYRETSNFAHLKYYGAAHRVHDGLGAKPFTTVLDPEWRAFIEKIHVEDLRKFLLRNKSTVQVDPVTKRLLLEQPIVQAFVTAPTHKTFVAYTAWACGPRTAEAVDAQNTKRIRKWYHKQLTN
jgi:hypothetical protein